MLVPAVAGLLLAWMSAVDPFGVWSALVVVAPGGGVLRDAQKLLAPWVVLAAAGAGVLARDLLRRASAGRRRHLRCWWPRCRSCSCRPWRGEWVGG